MLGDLSFDDLGEHFFGLAGHLRIFLHDVHLHAALMLDHVCRDLITSDVCRRHAGDLHRDVLRYGSILLSAQLGEHGDLAAHVHVRTEELIVILFYDSETAQRDLFADGRSRIGDDFLQRSLAAVACQRRSEISRALLDQHLLNGIEQCQELIVLGNEIGLGVHFEDHTDIAFDGNAAQTLCSDAAGFLRRLGDSLFAQPVDGLADVAVALSQGLLAVHHARAGLLT